MCAGSSTDGYPQVIVAGTGPVATAFVGWTNEASGGTLGALRMDEAFWQRQDVQQCLSRRDIGGLFSLVRRYSGASQHRIGAAVDLPQSRVSAIMNGKRMIAGFEVFERLADGLGMPDRARIQLGLAPREDAMRRRTALGIGLVAAISPATLTEVLRESAAEAVEFARERGTSAVGAGTLDHLTTVIAGLDRAYPWQPATELFPLARAYRQYVQQLINGQHTLAEARELYVHGAYLSHILADLSHGLGSTIAAKAYAADSHQLAEQAGHGELCAWACDTLAIVLLNMGKYDEATKAALRGLRVVPRRHPLAARLHARLAQTHAHGGNRAGCARSLAKARVVCDRLPAEMPSRLAIDSAEQTSHSITAYAAESHAELGEWKAAEQNARAALAVARWSPGRAARTHLYLGTAAAHLDRPDEAVINGERALTLSRDYGTLLRARTLDAALTSRYPDVPATKEFHDRYRHLAAQALTN